MSAPGERREALDRLAVTVLRMLAWERSIAADPKAAAMTVRAQEAVELAARDLTAAIDELPPPERPKGWGIGPGSETA